MVRHRHEGTANTRLFHVIDDTVEHNNGVVKRITQDREQRCNCIRGEFAPKERIGPDHDHEVVKQRNDRHQSHLVLESDRNIKDDQQ